MLTDEGVPLILKVAISCEQKSKWEVENQEDIKALHANDTWDLVELPLLLYFLSHFLSAYSKSIITHK